MSFLSTVTCIDWKKGVNENKSKLEQLSNRYIFILCIYLIKKSKKTRKKKNFNLNKKQ